MAIDQTRAALLLSALLLCGANQIGRDAASSPENGLPASRGLDGNFGRPCRSLRLRSRRRRLAKFSRCATRWCQVVQSWGSCCRSMWRTGRTARQCKLVRLWPTHKSQPPCRYARKFAVQEKPRHLLRHQHRVCAGSDCKTDQRLLLPPTCLRQNMF